MNATQITTPTQFEEATLEEARSILAIASDCDDREFLDRARTVYAPELLNLGAKRLSPAQHAKIMSWVLASKQTNTNSKKIEPVQSLER